MIKDILSCKDLSRDDIGYILKKSQEMERLVTKKGKLNLLCGKIAATLFFEPSTRTRLSFETAMHRMGGDVIGFSSVEGTSVKKGETLEDTIKTVDQYADVIIIRHPQIGAARIAADVADAPVINAGDGAGEHPTQALLDLYTIYKFKNTIDGLTIALVGDLKHARVMHSLAYALSNFEVTLYLVSPPMLKMPSEILEYLKHKQVNLVETETLDEVIKKVDVLYTVRIQKERFPSEEEYMRVKDSYKITPELLSNAKEDMIILHPLPRREELPPEIDKTPFAKYFEQAKNGVYVRMALLGIVLNVL
ncbi:aspartate carbamoyltransferase [Thermococcus sp.]|uniref:aspartate carbamoyltransferase n=1 Tax=Thermococcus sp. TaxID=35749 RepID=UPI00199006C1|nr:aspartate carbamoyltransferase [Thermococcus sp.]MBC7094887.1 aspartate carbamoyltransferase [Thermococcus sp.]